jgi:hypothetical protein
MRILVMGLLIVSAQAHAGPSAEDRARVLYSAGKDHYEHGQYEVAATEFEAAYALMPRPELRYNLYLTYERVGRFDVALGHLDAYLANAKLTPDERAHLQAQRDALRRRAEAAPAPAPEVETAAPAPARSGFMARLALGLGYANAETEDYRLYGGTGDVTLLVGWRVSDRLAIHASFWGGSMVGATIQAKRGLLSIFQVADDATYTAGAVGAGICLDLPARFWISGSLGGATITADRGGAKAQSDVGVALLLFAGKDWQLGGSWSAGLAASLSFLSIPEKIDETTGTHEVRSSAVLFALLGSIAFD